MPITINLIGEIVTALKNRKNPCDLICIFLLIIVINIIDENRQKKEKREALTTRFL